ncbi:MAG: T9SS type A sorting domain-containing protein [Bacteroidales bacterium]|nr:T9SS type A sorting domain-containing protein [Bacteroidales bacterium]
MNTTFTAVAYNENGSTRGTPLYVPMKSTAGVEVVEDATAVVERIVVYDLSGRVVFDGTPETFGSEQLSSGVYVKKEVLKGGVSRTSKIVVR